jgi:hypothetical protein
MLRGSRTTTRQLNQEDMMATQMDALGELICRLNPYTESENKTTGLKTEEMELGSDMNADQRTPADKKKIDEMIKKIAVEVESNYSEQWTFKGQPVKVKAAMRIPYQFEVKKNGSSYWQKETLIIGFAGDQGGG